MCLPCVTGFKPRIYVANDCRYVGSGIKQKKKRIVRIQQIDYILNYWNMIGYSPDNSFSAVSTGTLTFRVPWESLISSSFILSFCFVNHSFVASLYRPNKVTSLMTKPTQLAWISLIRGKVDMHLHHMGWYRHVSNGHSHSLLFGVRKPSSSLVDSCQSGIWSRWLCDCGEVKIAGWE